MPKVEIYQLQSNGTQKTIVACQLRGDVVECVGDEQIVAGLVAAGVPNTSSDSPEMVTIHDGRQFLVELSKNFNSAYVSASPVME